MFNPRGLICNAVETSCCVPTAKVYIEARIDPQLLYPNLCSYSHYQILIKLSLIRSETRKCDYRPCVCVHANMLETLEHRATKPWAFCPASSGSALMIRTFSPVLHSWPHRHWEYTGSYVDTHKHTHTHMLTQTMVQYVLLHSGLMSMSSWLALGECLCPIQVLILQMHKHSPTLAYFSV